MQEQYTAAAAALTLTSAHVVGVTTSHSSTHSFLMQEQCDAAAASTLKSARVVGMTTSGLAKMQPLIATLAPRIMFIEEAAEIFEAHVLAAVSRVSAPHCFSCSSRRLLRSLTRAGCSS